MCFFLLHLRFAFVIVTASSFVVAVVVFAAAVAADGSLHKYYALIYYHLISLSLFLSLFSISAVNSVSKNECPAQAQVTLPLALSHAVSLAQQLLAKLLSIYALFTISMNVYSYCFVPLFEYTARQEFKTAK